MSRKFNVGDRVKVNRPDSTYHGEVCTIVRDLTWTQVVEHVGGTPARTVWRWTYRVDLPTSSSRFAGVSYEPHELVPIYDGDEPAQWADCVWQPRKVSA